VTDRWLVVGQRVTEDDRIQTQRTYLIGEGSGGMALLLHFAAGGGTLDKSYPPGTSFEGEIVYFDSAVPLRAIVKRREAIETLTRVPGHTAIREATAVFAGVVARSPWIERFPLALQSVVPVRDGTGWTVRDLAGDYLPVTIAYENAWRLAAVSGGHPVSLVGEWDGSALLPLSVVADGRFWVV
jgi:hypothetical protein